MAVDRWFGGIEAKHNIWIGSTFVAESNKDSYFLDFHFRTDAANKLVDLKIYGTPILCGIHQVLAHTPALGEQVDYGRAFFRHLKQLSLLYPVVVASAINIWIMGFGSVVSLPSGKGTRTYNRVITEYTDNELGHLEAHMYSPDTNEWVMEKQIDASAKPIVQPVHQGGAMQGAVADQLNIVSTSANDTLAGTGMQKVIMCYYDVNLAYHESDPISLNGLTPVDLIALGYTDVYVIKALRGSQWGALGYNAGDIFLQDDP